MIDTFPAAILPTNGTRPTLLVINTLDRVIPSAYNLQLAKDLQSPLHAGLFLLGQCPQGRILAFPTQSWAHYTRKCDSAYGQQHHLPPIIPLLPLPVCLSSSLKITHHKSGLAQLLPSRRGIATGQFDNQLILLSRNQKTLAKIELPVGYSRWSSLRKVPVPRNWGSVLDWFKELDDQEVIGIMWMRILKHSGFLKHLNFGLQFSVYLFRALNTGTLVLSRFQSQRYIIQFLWISGPPLIYVLQ